MISIIVCQHKGTLIDQAIKTLLLSENIDFEILIMTSDQACKKKYSNFHPKIRSIFMEGGPAIKRNASLKFSNGESLAFFDDDIEVLPNTVLEMKRILDLEKIGMVFGKILNMEFRDRFDEAGSFLTWTGFLLARAESGVKDEGQFDRIVPVLAGKSASCMIRKKVFIEVGKFDESYEILAEETDLAWRIWLYGYKIMYVPTSITYHAFGTRFKPRDFYVPRRVYYNGCRNYISMLLTNLGHRKVCLPVFIQTGVWFFAAMGMFLTGKPEAGKNILKGLFYVLSHIPSILQKRNLVQSQRKISDKQLLPLITFNPPVSYYIKRLFQYIKEGEHGGSYKPIKS